MKRFFFLSLTVLALTATSSCSKDEEPSPAPLVVQSNSMTGKLDGGLLSIANYSYVNPSNPATPEEMTLLFYTKADLTEYIEIHIPISTVPGTYPLTDTGLEYVKYLDATGWYISTSGTLQIGTHDKTNKVITGNFQASMIPAPGSSATSTHDFTNVQFVLNY